MQATTKTYLNFVLFSDLINWSVQYMLDTKFSYADKYELVEIGEFLKRNKTAVDVEDEEEYKRVTIKINNGGVFLRDIERGINIGTKKQFRVSEGQFLLSKIDARNGAFGVVSKEVDNAIVTNDFPSFDIDITKINPQFLLLITTTKAFIKFAQSCSSGTTNRQRMDIDTFLTQKIPLPSLEEQEQIVENYNAGIRQAETLEQKANDLEKEIEEYWFEMLGIEREEKKKRKGLHFAEFKDIQQWGVDKLLSAQKGGAKSKFETYKIGDLCKISSGGTPSRSRKDIYYGGQVPWIKTGELNNNVLLDTEEKITEEGLKNSSAKLYPTGSIVIAMYGATIGKSAKLGIDATTNQACAVLFDIDNLLIDTNYLWEYLQSQTENLKKLAYGSAQPNLNAKTIFNFEIKVPPVSIQEEIVNHIQNLKTEIKNLRQTAEENRKGVIKEFEQEIFN